MNAHEYLALFQEIRGKVASDEVALALLEQHGKDARVLAMQQRNGNGNGLRSYPKNVDEPATPKQLSYLRAVGAEIPAVLSKRGASQLIDQHKQYAEQQLAQN